MRWFASFCALALSAGSLFAAGELSGRRAPGFSLPDNNFTQHDLGDYRGRVVLIDIMQTNCPHCQVFAKTLEQVKAKYGQRVAILSVVNPPDNMDTVKQYLVRTFSTIPVLFDCGQMAASYLKITPQNPRIAVPHVFVIDGSGMIRNDFDYRDSNKEIFEGKGLYPEIDKLLGPRKK